MASPMNAPILSIPNPFDNHAIGRYLELQDMAHVPLFRSAAASGAGLGNHVYSVLYRVTFGAKTNTGGGAAIVSFDFALLDIYGNAVTEAHKFKVEVDSSDVYDPDIPVAVFYKLSETGAGLELDTSHRDGSPVGAHPGPRPWLTGMSSATGTGTIAVARVHADGATAAITGAAGSDVRLHIGFDVQVEAQKQTQGQRIILFT